MNQKSLSIILIIKPNNKIPTHAYRKGNANCGSQIHRNEPKLVKDHLIQEDPKTQLKKKKHKFKSVESGFLDDRLYTNRFRYRIIVIKEKKLRIKRNDSGRDELT